MGELEKLNHLLTLLQQNAAKIGITIGGLMIAVYAIFVMFDNDQSPQGRTERWAKLRRVMIAAAIIAGVGAFITFSTSLGGML